MGLKLSGGKKPAPSRPLGLAKPGGLKPGKVAASTGPSARHPVKRGGTFEKAAQAQAEYERRKAMPWGASLPVGTENLQVYFLDDGDPFSNYEHNIGGSKSKPGKTYPCIKDTNEPCPACNKDPKGDGYFVMRLTAVIPKITITKQDGEVVTYHFQKKEWRVKIKMIKKYQRLYQQHGTFRGMVVRVSRDGKLDPATGNDVEFVKMLSEAEIKKYAANPKYAEAKLAEAFDFEKLYKNPTAAELRKMLGATDEAAGSSDFAEDDDDDFGGGSSGADADDEWG